MTREEYRKATKNVICPAVYPNPDRAERTENEKYPLHCSGLFVFPIYFFIYGIT